MESSDSAQECDMDTMSWLWGRVSFASLSDYGAYLIQDVRLGNMSSPTLRSEVLRSTKVENQRRRAKRRIEEFARVKLAISCHGGL